MRISAVFCVFVPYFITLINIKDKDYHLYKPEKTGMYVMMHNKQKLDVEEFLPLALYAIIPEKFDDESQKTMIVILRTYIANKMQEHENINQIRVDDLGLPCTTYENLMKKWGDSYEVKYNKVMRLVEETNGERIYFNNELIYPAYHELSAGITNSGDAEYLKSVESASDKDAQNFMNILYFSAENMKTKLHEYNKDINTEDLSQNVKVTNKENSEYIDHITIGDTDISVTDFVRILEIPSEAFTLEPFEDGFKIISKGKGSGKGLSIYGARQMAKQGKNYKDILSYYYTGIEVK